MSNITCPEMVHASYCLQTDDCSGYLKYHLNGVQTRKERQAVLLTHTELFDGLCTERRNTRGLHTVKHILDKEHAQLDDIDIWPTRTGPTVVVCISLIQLST